MSLLLACDHYVYEHFQHDIKREGLSVIASRFWIFFSEKAHFRIQKSLAFLGLGHQSIVRIKADPSFCMDVELLETAIIRERK
ncbi:MAG: hypothetical protein ACMUEM_07915 [Flavobacteriales bacterium AspAUS03]